MSVDATTPADDVVLTRTPRAGELSPTWRLLTALTWIAVAVAVGSVWKTSDQLGLSTWWLGPRGDPNPLPLQVMPFVPSLIVLVGAINQWRRLPWLGVAASTIGVAVGIGDLGRVTRLGLVEIAIGVASLAVSIASFTGMYRPAGEAPAVTPADA